VSGLPRVLFVYPLAIVLIAVRCYRTVLLYIYYYIGTRYTYYSLGVCKGASVCAVRQWYCRRRSYLLNYPYLPTTNVYTKTVPFWICFLSDPVWGFDGNLRNQRYAGIARVQGHHADGVEDFAWQSIAQGLADTAWVHDQPPICDRGFRVPENEKIINATWSSPPPPPPSLTP